ncbi:hypothetical protein CJO80_27105 (plasmid) [Ralstonia solanacearum]|nr:hypothetical protein CJO80_27105 [Ralstonia solanacearum]
MTANPPPLALKADSLENIAEPFDGDWLGGRAALARRLTGYVDRLRCGAVLAIDAPWGEGKTWFARHWVAQLRKDGHRVGLIDAFQQDYVEDPFLLLAAEIRHLCKANQPMAKKMTERAVAVAKVVMPQVTKLAINAAVKLAGTSDAVEKFQEQIEAVGEKGADAAQAWIKKRIEQYDTERETVQAFRQELEAFAQADARPVIIVIDELDRCRPAFAVRLVERIKHFFDVPNLVFVLVMNRDQLEKAIKGVYGAETDAAAYLGKFLNLSLSLPKERSLDVSGPVHPAASFAHATLKRYGYEAQAGRYNDCLCTCAVALDLSLRDIERVCALLFLSESSSDRDDLRVFLAALKIKHPAIFNGLRAFDDVGTNACLALLRAAYARFDGMERGDWSADFCRSLIGLFDRDLSPEEANWQRENSLYQSDYRRQPEALRKAISRVIAKLELDVK